MGFGLKSVFFVKSSLSSINFQSNIHGRSHHLVIVIDTCIHFCWMEMEVVKFTLITYSTSFLFTFGFIYFQIFIDLLFFSLITRLIETLTASFKIGMILFIFCLSFHFYSLFFLHFL